MPCILYQDRNSECQPKCTIPFLPIPIAKPRSIVEVASKCATSRSPPLSVTELLESFAYFTTKINNSLLMKILTSCLLTIVASATMAQLPTTDLYMISMTNNGQKISVTDPLYLSGFNPDGYNNQPYFINPNQLYITSDLYDNTFTDVVKLDLRRQEYYRVTATDSISEYSPTPRAIRGFFSTVRVEKDMSTQSLWLYPKDHQSYGHRVLTDIGTVGYHCWISEEEVALFLVGTPMTLAIGNISDNTTKTILENIGRCFRQQSDGSLLFVHKVTEESWYIKAYDPESGQVSIVTRTRPDSEDFELLKDGNIIMGEGSKLYIIDPSTDEYWSELTDLAEFGITNISRLAESRNQLVIVDNPK